MVARFQTASDLHIDRYFPYQTPSPIEFDARMQTLLQPHPHLHLIVAGDITRVVDRNDLYVLFLQWCSQNWKHVFIICGNHEYYVESVLPQDAPSMDDINKYIKDVCRALGNVHFLNNSRMSILEDGYPPVHIWGGTLWSRCLLDISLPIYVPRGTTTSREEMDVQCYNELHEKSLQSLMLFIRDMMSEEDDAMVIVVTHHSPTFKHMRPSHRNTRRSSMYATDLEYLFQREFVDVWIAGHTHDNIDMNPHHPLRTRFISNCDPEEPTYNPTFLFS